MVSQRLQMGEESGMTRERRLHDRLINKARAYGRITSLYESLDAPATAAGDAERELELAALEWAEEYKREKNQQLADSLDQFKALNPDKK